LLALATGAGLAVSTAQAADLPVRPYVWSATTTSNDQAAMAAAPGRDITGTVNARATAQMNQAQLTAAINHARAARAHFTEARAAMERGILLREAAPKGNLVALDAAMNALLQDMKALERMGQPRSAAAVKMASGLVQDWYQAGSKIINPPAQGVLELPLPMTVARKADAAAAALDQVIEGATAQAVPQRAIGSPKRRAQTAPRPVVRGADAGSLVPQLIGVHAP
jgi:hypothetical protein